MSRINSEPRPRVCTVILNWNQPEMTAECVKSVLGQEASSRNSVLVIDNGSTTENRAALAAALPCECKLIQNDQNLGFAGGMNIGIHYALEKGFEYLWLLNNDAFPSPGCMDALVSAMDADATLTIVTPRLIYPDGTPQQLGGCVDWETAHISPMLGTDFPRPAEKGWYVTGAAPLFRSDVLRSVGGFDSRFFAYWEDVDLCTRIISGGGNFGVANAATCVHLESATSGRNSPINTHLNVRNGWLFVSKHRNVLSWPRLWLRQTASRLKYAGKLKERGHDKQALAVLTALWDGMTNRFHKPRRIETNSLASQFILNHYWGISRLMWTAANVISPPRKRRPPLQ